MKNVDSLTIRSGFQELSSDSAQFLTPTVSNSEAMVCQMDPSRALTWREELDRVGGPGSTLSSCSTCTSGEVAHRYCTLSGRLWTHQTRTGSCGQQIHRQVHLQPKQAVLNR